MSTPAWTAASRPHRRGSATWEHWTDGSPSSPGPAAASGASTPCSSPPKGPRWWSTTWVARSTGPATTGPPAQQVVDEITAAGGQAVANADDVCRLGGRQAADRHGHRGLRRPARPGQQRRHPARPGAGQHVRGRLGLGHPGPSEGPLRPHPPRRRLLAGPDQGRDRRSRRRWSTPPRPRACWATRASPTTARPRPASPPSPPSPPTSWSATGSGSTPSPRPPAPG